MNKSTLRLVYSLGVLTCALPLVLSTSAISNVKAEGLFDYSDGTNIETLKAGDFLEKSGTTLTESEIEYLNERSTNSLTYSKAFLNDEVKTSRIGEKDYVFAHEINYVDQAKREWTWTPLYVRGESNHPFVSYDGTYVSEFNHENNSQNVDIIYELSLDILPQVYNSFINESYEHALSFKEVYDQYQEDLAYYDRRPKSELEYDTQLSNYNQYLEDYQSYLNKKENYETYLANKAKYDEDLEAYNAYLVAKKQYDQDVIAYKKNQEDWAYYLANHEQNQKEYEEYGIKYDNSRYQLSAMQIAYEQDIARDSSLATYILSNTVATVLARKDELSVLGVPTDLVDNADQSTVKLRTCFREYNALTTNEARYSYYYINYNYIKSNAITLLRSLEKLGRFQSVINVARDRGKLPQFYTLLFQLIYFCNAVSDTTIYNYEAYNPITGKGDMSKAGAAILDENFLIDGQTYLTWLKGYEFIDTSKTATPSTGILPTQQVILIPEPPTLPVPVEPAMVQKPIAPTVVEEPLAPEEVLEPIPYDPSATSPEYPAILSNELNANLLDDYLKDKVHQKDQLSDSVSISIEGSRNVKLNQDKVAIFNDYLGQHTHFVFFSDGGVTYNFEVPSKPADEYFSEYLFDYWSNETGENPPSIDLRTITNSIELFPVFDHGERQRYDITWVYPDGNEVRTVSSGSIPSAPKNPTKESNLDHYYVFDRWDPEISEANAPAIYTALFNEFNIFDIQYEIDGNIVSTREKENYLPNAPKTYEDGQGTYYVLTDWILDGSSNPGLSPISGNALYHAVYEKYYTITWNILGEISTEKYLEGSQISYKGVIPETIREEQFYKVFTFDQAFGVANANKTITATYVNHAYPEVILKIDDRSMNLTGNYLPGEEIDKPTSYHTDFYHYDITGWNKNGSTYVATFTKTPYIGNDIYFNYVNETLKIDASLKNLNEINLSYLFSKINDGEYSPRPMKIIFKDGEVNFSTNQVRYLAMRSGVNIKLEFVDLGNKSYSIRLLIQNEQHQDVLIPDFYPEIFLKKNVDHLHSQVYLNDEEVNASLEYGLVKFRSQINLTYEIIPTYVVSVSASNAVNFSLSKQEGRVGEKIHLNYDVKKGYKLEIFSIRTKGGLSVQIDQNNDFILPADDVVINFVCSRVQYSLKLYVDDALYASYKVNYGDTITLPTYIKKVGDETFEYLFTGWGISADSIAVNEDTVLYAQFVKVEREQKSERKTSNLVQIAGFVAVGSLTLGLGVGMFFIFRKIRKH